MAFKILLFFSLFFILTRTPFAASNQVQDSNPFKVLASKIENKARSLMQASLQVKDKKEKLKKEKTNAEKIQEDRQLFSEKEQARKSDFLKKLKKLQGKDLSGEARQKAVSKFYSKELERKQEFAEEMNRKVLKSTRRKESKL